MDTTNEPGAPPSYQQGLHYDRPEGLHGRIKTVNVPPVPEEIFEGLQPYERSVQGFTIAGFEILGDDALQNGQSPRLYYLHRPPIEQLTQVYSIKNTDDAHPERVTYFETKGGWTIREWKPILRDNLRGKCRKGGAVFEMSFGGSEVQLWRYWENNAQDAGVEFEVTAAELDNKPGVGRFERVVSDGFKYLFPVISKDGRGRHLAFSSNKENNKDTKVYVVDLTQPGWVPTVAFDNQKGFSSARSFSADETLLMIKRKISVNDMPYYIVDLEHPESAPKRLLLPGIDENAVVAIRQAEFSKRPGSLEVFVCLNGYGDFTSFVVYDLQTNVARHITTPGPAFNSLHPIPWNVKFVANTESQAIFVANVDGYSEAFQYGVESGKFTRVLLSGYEKDLVMDIGIEDPSFRSHSFCAQLTSPHNASHIVAVDIPDPKSVVVTPYVSCQTERPPYPTQDPALIRYKSFDGLSIPAWISKPPAHNSSRKLPVIVYLHGGPTTQVMPSFPPSLTAYLVNKLGIAVISPNFRGSSNYGKAYELADDVYKREDSVRDIGALLEHIRTSMPEMDASRIAVMGERYGGYMALACLVHYSPLIRCGVVSAGIASLPTYLEATHPSRRAALREEFGDERDPKVRAFLEEMSPINHVDKMNVPLYISQGEKDKIMPVDAALIMFDKLRSKGLDAWLVVGEQEGHGFKQKDCVEFVNASKALFLKRWLLGDGQLCGEDNLLLA